MSKRWTLYYDRCKQNIGRFWCSMRVWKVIFSVGLKPRPVQRRGAVGAQSRKFCREYVKVIVAIKVIVTAHVLAASIFRFNSDISSIGAGILVALTSCPC